MELLTGAEAGRLVGVTRSCISGWRRRGLLTSFSTVRGVVAYRAEDVLAVAATPRQVGWKKGRPRKKGADDAE